jgi:predicted Fe-Mo cluster-binding NifX family protein
MRIAVAASSPAVDAVVPDTYECSPALLVIETDDMSLVGAVVGPNMEEYYNTIMDYDCEAVVTSSRIGQEAFEPLAKACITRFDGKGLPVLEAAAGALHNRLALVSDYDGGNGCESGTHGCGTCD